MKNNESTNNTTQHNGINRKKYHVSTRPAEMIEKPALRNSEWDWSAKELLEENMILKKVLRRLGKSDSAVTFSIMTDYYKALKALIPRIKVAINKLQTNNIKTVEDLKDAEDLNVSFNEFEKGMISEIIDHHIDFINALNSDRLLDAFNHLTLKSIVSEIRAQNINSTKRLKQDKDLYDAFSHLIYNIAQNESVRHRKLASVIDDLKKIGLNDEDIATFAAEQATTRRNIKFIDRNWTEDNCIPYCENLIGLEILKVKATYIKKKEITISVREKGKTEKIKYPVTTCELESDNQIKENGEIGKISNIDKISIKKSVSPEEAIVIRKDGTCIGKVLSIIEKHPEEQFVLLALFLKYTPQQLARDLLRNYMNLSIKSSHSNIDDLQTKRAIFSECSTIFREIKALYDNVDLRAFKIEGIKAKRFALDQKNLRLTSSKIALIAYRMRKHLDCKDVEIMLNGHSLTSTIHYN